LAFCPYLAKDIRVLSWMAVLDMLLNITFSILLARIMGVEGVLAGGILGSSLMTYYLTNRGPRYFLLTALDLLRPAAWRWSILILYAAAAYFLCRFVDGRGQNLWLRGTICVGAIGVFLWLYWTELSLLIVGMRRTRSGSDRQDPAALAITQ
jgi:peptidoglycan biosynthesis protein MviN/MurJ (putative lipid II flippase)